MPEHTTSPKLAFAGNAAVCNAIRMQIAGLKKDYEKSHGNPMSVAGRC